MTVGQVISDGLMWCRFIAVNSSVGRNEVKLIFLEAFQSVYNKAVISNSEYFVKSQAFSGTSITLPANFRQEKILLVNDSGCTSGYVNVVPIQEWSVRQQNSRLKGTTVSPLGRKDPTVFTISNSITSGTMFYICNFAETDLTDESQDLILFLPLIFHGLLLSKMQELIRARHMKVVDSPSETERQMNLMKMSMIAMKRSLRPLEIVEALSEKPQSMMLAQ